MNTEKNRWQNTLCYEISPIGSNRLFVKREDLLPFSFGGNKARKAELFFEDVISKGCNHVVTYGSSSSNHCRVISNKACSLGIKCTIISPEEDYVETSNTKLTSLFGADYIFAPLSEIKTTIESTIKNLENKGEKPYFIQGGGHGNIGTRAFVECFNEILDFEKQCGVEFDYIFHASGTGTTQAGLIAGAFLSKRDVKIIGISIARKNPYGFEVVKNSVKEYLTEESADMSELNFENHDFDDSYICEGYGKYNAEIINTICKVIKKDGIPLNTTYSGKAFWGMKEYLKKNKVENKNILFINTGGAPLFFDTLDNLGD